MDEPPLSPDEKAWLDHLSEHADEINEAMAQLRAQPEPKEHDLQRFIRQVSSELSAEYKRIQMRAKEDPGTAGDEGEENWAEILREWLPRSFEVVTKGRIISQEGEVSPQIDVLILDENYPAKLMNKKMYLAAGVAAAFECKITLKASHIEEAMCNCASVKSLYPKRVGTPYQELHSPIVYGVLAHSHVWKNKKSKPAEKISAKLAESDRKHVNHPRQMLDLLTVADLGTWTSDRTVTFKRPSRTYFSVTAPEPGYPPSPTSTYMYRTGEIGTRRLEPVAILLTRLFSQLAWERVGMRSMAEYYLRASLGAGSGTGLPSRVWTGDIYSRDTRQVIEAGLKTYTRPWDEWSLFF